MNKNTDFHKYCDEKIKTNLTKQSYKITLFMKQRIN